MDEFLREERKAKYLLGCVRVLRLVLKRLQLDSYNKLKIIVVVLVP